MILPSVAKLAVDPTAGPPRHDLGITPVIDQIARVLRDTTEYIISGQFIRDALSIPEPGNIEPASVIMSFILLTLIIAAVMAAIAWYAAYLNDQNQPQDQDQSQDRESNAPDPFEDKL